MVEIHWAAPLNDILRQCSASHLDRMMLDCGAGSDQPLLSIFFQQGYRTCGIELAHETLTREVEFYRLHNINLNVFRGDMRHIPTADETFSFAYSFNAIFFMEKPDIALAVQEMKRVLIIRRPVLC